MMMNKGCLSPRMQNKMNNKTKARAQASQERNKDRDTGIERVKWIAICLRKWEWTTRDKVQVTLGGCNTLDGSILSLDMCALLTECVWLGRCQPLSDVSVVFLHCCK